MSERKAFKPSAGNEAANSFERRMADGFFDKYIKGDVIDIGCGKEKIVEDARGWDIANGDSDCQYMEGVEDESYDTVYASHVLEHVENPVDAINSWWRILKKDGFLIIAVPDEDLYEQGLWPSMFNSDHKHRFTIHKDGQANNRINLIDLVKDLPNHRIEYIKLCDTNYDYEKASNGPIDQTNAERQIELVVHKYESQDFINTNKNVFRCGCGGTRLLLQAIDISGRLKIKCLECGQIGAIGVRQGG